MKILFTLFLLAFNSAINAQEIIPIIDFQSGLQSVQSELNSLKSLSNRSILSESDRKFQKDLEEILKRDLFKTAEFVLNNQEKESLVLIAEKYDLKFSLVVSNKADKVLLNK